MSSRTDPAARLRSRRSIAHVPRSKMTSLDKENATADFGAGVNSKPAVKDKKSRSKSLGPGGLDALQNSNGNRRKSTAAFPLKSILKPTIPVAVRNIPSFEETRNKRTPARNVPQSHDGTADDDGRGKEGLLIDFETTPQPSRTENANTTNPFDTFNATSAIRDEMAATKERDEKERQEREKQGMLEKREARRKSLANRRVSFAPEATLHTWNVNEILDDSTSSSTSNSTRRASSLTNSSNVPPPSTPAAEAPSSPADSEFGFSPVRQQDLQQIASGTREASHDLSSSPFSGSSVSGSEDTGAQSMAGEEVDDRSSGSEDGFDAESTAMSMEDMTDTSSRSSSSARLNEALQHAAREAGTRAVDEDEGEMSMEIADQEITGAFQPWIKKGQRQSFDWEDISARHDQENVDPSKVAAPPQTLPESEDTDYDEDLSMDVTNAVGRILGQSAGRRKSVVRRKSSGEQSDYDDQTMEMTNVVGGIAPPTAPNNVNEDGDMTMEFTGVVGGVLSRNAENTTPKSDRMDTDVASDDDMDMEMTGAIGGILPSGVQASDKAQAKRLMELETESGQLNSSPFQENVSQSPAKSPAKSPLNYQVAAVASENGSPSLASVRSRVSRHSSTLGASSTPVSANRLHSPVRKPSTPSKQTTPRVRPTTPSKTPPSANVTFRSASPKKLFQPEISQSSNKRKSLRQSIFEQNTATGESTPLVVLQPREGRRSSGLGIDKEGLGSPRVAAMLDKRLSLGENTPQFVPHDRARGGVRFEDPLKLQEEEDRARQEEELREDGHIRSSQSGEKDVTANLKDMISSLSPKKTKVGSRKSLHVGAARGVLGKRPVELDTDEEEAENSPKRLRGHDVSPVKGVRLPPHTSKDETARRSMRSPLRRASSSSPLKGSATPAQEPRRASKPSTTPLKNGIEFSHIASDPQQPEQEEDTPTEEVDGEYEPIELQDFLNMTNIHFMELTTTKRRHTTAPGSATKRLSRNRRSGEDVPKPGIVTFDDCVAAGFCTVPMLELYQHSCRELKSYISEGRQVIRSIEIETCNDNPPLFREYVTAPPDIRVIMDNQFRNVKTHARLLSKATWYEWRMKLLEGLKEGLNRHVEEMKADDALLTKREKHLNSTVPQLVEKHGSLEQEAANLQLLVDEMESCDQNELRGAREKLSGVEAEIEAKKRELQQLQEEVKEKNIKIEAGAEVRAEYLAQIQEAERVKEECRGWSAREISALKASVQRIERQTGWSIVSASAPSDSSTGPLLCMSYRDQLQLKFHPQAFAVKNATQINLPLELISAKSKSISPIASLVLQSLQHHLSTIQQSRISPKQLLRFITDGWNRMLGLETEARMLEFCGVTRLTLSGPNEKSLSLRARCTLLGTGSSSTPARKGSAAKSTAGAKRIDVDFSVRTRIQNQNSDALPIGSLDFDVDVLATKIYGFGSGNKSGLANADMKAILGKGLAKQNDGQDDTQLGNGMWCKAVRVLEGSAF